MKLDRALALFSSYKNKSIRVITHYDADGISSAAILTKALQRAQCTFSLRTVHQLSEEVLQELSKESYDFYIFGDLGAGQYPFIKQYISKPLIILDHHEYDQEIIATMPHNHIMINPLMENIDPQAMSGAGVCFLFAQALDSKNQDLAHIAIIGALGDMQYPLQDNNLEFVDTAIKQKMLETQKTISWFGIETKPLLKLLVSYEPIIPGITGNESAAMQLLVDLEIPVKQEDWTYYDDLTEEQKQALISRIIMLRVKEKNPQDIFGDRYILSKEQPRTPFRDAKEFATLLNACGRLERTDIGIGALLHDQKSKEEALSTLLEYRQHIVQALRWYDQHKEQTIKGDKYLIINAKDNVLATIIGTLASMMTHNNSLEPGTIVMSLARNENDTTKVSIRVAGDTDDDLREMVTAITNIVGGEAGGHQQAAGALIPTAIEDTFIEHAKKIFENL